MLALRYACSIALAALALSVPEVGAQQQTPQDQSQQPQSQQGQNGNVQPIPAYRSPLASAADNGPIQDASGGADQLEPDTRLPAGAQNLSLGAPRTGHRYWAPYVDATSSAYSNSALGTGGTTWSTYASFSGGVNFREVSGQSDLTLTYLGGGSISSDGSNNSTVQQLGIAERYTFHRSVIAVIDQFDYLPQAGFGYNGLGTGALGANGNGNVGLGINGNGNIGLQTGFATDQTILTASGRQVTNSSVVELDRYLTRRSSLTFVGTYSLDRFLDSNLSNSNEAIFQAGYNYQLDRKSTITLFYRFEAFRYGNGAQSINDHSVQASYVRRVVGRLVLQLSGGPDFAISQTPISASGSVTNPGKTTLVSWDANPTLTYQFRRSQLQATYFHGVTNGSGVLAGSVSDIFSGDASRQFTRRLTADWTIGYSRNTGPVVSDTGLGVPGTTPLSPTSSQTYNYWFSGVGITRTVGRAINLYLGYEIQYQNSNSPSCVTAPCSTSFLNHQISLGLGWHPQPYVRR